MISKLVYFILLLTLTEHFQIYKLLHVPLLFQMFVHINICLKEFRQNSKNYYDLGDFEFVFGTLNEMYKYYSKINDKYRAKNQALLSKLIVYILIK